jgi:hypothetical protein
MKENVRQTFLQDMFEDKQLILKGLADKKFLLDAVKLAQEYSSFLKAIPPNFASLIVDRLGRETFTDFFDDSINLFENWNTVKPTCLPEGFKNTLANVLELETLGHMIPDIRENPYSKGLNDENAYFDIVEGLDEIKNIPKC